MGIEEIYKHLVIQGPLGIFCVVFLYGYVNKDKALQKHQKSCTEKQEALINSHHAAISAFQEQYVKNLTELAEKYQERAEALEDLVELLNRRS